MALYRAKIEFEIKVKNEDLTFIRYITARSENALEELAHQIAKDIIHEYGVSAIDYNIYWLNPPPCQDFY